MKTSLDRSDQRALLLGLTFAAFVSLGADPGGAIEKDAFRFTYDERGVTGLENPHDPFGAQIVPAGQRLGLTVRYRIREGDWVTLPASQTRVEAASGENVTFLNDAVPGPLRVRQTFETDGTVLDWRIALEAMTNSAVEIGDLAISIPAAGPRGEDPKQIFERGFVRHQFISGNGSFVYFIRASGAPPYLIVTVRPGTSLEYFGGGGGRGGASVFVHSKATGDAEKRGTWRHAHTARTLEPAGQEGSKAEYAFRFRWANSHAHMREILFEEGLFDIRVVPGMVIPEDLTARFALHTKAHIDGIDAEFPANTKITRLGETRPGYQLYEVSFKKLGENMLTIRHDGGGKSHLEFFVTEPIETLIRKRAAFLVNRQQIRDPSKWWNGVFGPYDMKNKVVRTIDDPDIFLDRMVYVLTCDDPGLCKAPFLAAKNVSFPDRSEIEAIEYYLEHFVWGKLQRTDQEKPYPYGVYGTPHWHINRDPERRKAYAEASGSATAMRDLGKEHVWRSYDYPHVVMLYFHMYEIAKRYPDLSKYLDAAGYLERAYQTARAFFTYPYEIYWTYYETYKWGLYNELIVLELAEALDREGFPDRAAWLRAEWEKKVKYFVYDDPYPFRSEYAFDRTAFESTYAFAKYGATHDMASDTNLWYDRKLEKWYSHPAVNREDSREFMERQLAAGLCVRGWLEASYHQLGADPGLSYMAAMGGWGILDYALNFAEQPYDWLQLGYASYLSSWCLVNSGPPENNFGFWFPGKENDGAAGWQFMSAKVGSAWMGSSYPGGVQVPRGPWHYDGEIDLGFGGALRMAATVLTRDPVFGWCAYGANLEVSTNALSLIPRDGLRRRFHAVIGVPGDSKTSIQRLKLELERDGFAAGEKLVVSPSLERLAFTLENRTGDDHNCGLRLSFPEGTTYAVLQDGEKRELQKTANWDYPWRVDLKVSQAPGRIELIRVPTEN